MIPVTFTYQRASSVDEALDLASQGEETKFLARRALAAPADEAAAGGSETLIDIGRLRELSYIRDDGSHLAVGALTSHHDVATSDLLARELPLLAHAASHVGDPQVRHCTRSAARWRTVTPRPTFPPSSWLWTQR